MFRPNSVFIFLTNLNIKSFPSHKGHWAALISVSTALSQIPAEAASPAK